MKSSVEKSSYGKLPDGTEIGQYTLVNSNGLSCKVITFGAIITELRAPDSTGKMGDIVLGFDNLDGYVKGHPYFGAAIGRVANRIAKGQFKLNGKSFSVATNNGPNHLHGGIKGFDKVVWKAEVYTNQLGPCVKFTYLSPDGEEGYPGNLTVIILYTLTEKNELRIDYMAKSDKDTPINLTNHSYFNLNPKDKENQADILGHIVQLNAKRYTPVDDTLIPTGELKKVSGSPMDFTKPMPIGSRIGKLTNTPRGYDHNYVLKSEVSQSPEFAARVYEPESGRGMEIYTTEPGLQFYTGNFLDGTLTGKGGVVYKKHFGFCMETDHFPDSINHPKFPTIVLKAGETYTQTTIHKFLVRVE